MSRRTIARDGSDGLPRVIDVTGEKGRSIIIGFGAGSPPEPPANAGCSGKEHAGHEDQPAEARASSEKPRLRRLTAAHYPR